MKTCELYIDGHPVETTIFVQENYLMVPALFFKYTGTTVDWNDINNSIVLKRNNITLSLSLGNNYLNYCTKETNKWQRDYLPTTTLDICNSTYIPLQYTVEKFGMTVSHNSDQSLIYIITNDSPYSKPEVYYRGDTRGKKVALTFDDGPDDICTPQILDILRNHQVPATFFVVGQQIQLFPQILRRIVKEGHTLGNHGWNHVKLEQLTTANVIAEVQSTEMEIESVSGFKTGLFRPPFGSFTDADIRIINDLGFQVVMWSVDTKDWQGLSDKQILSVVQRDESPGAIILQHSFTGIPKKLDGTIKALPKIIHYLYQEGYEFVSVQNLISK